MGKNEYFEGDYRKKPSQNLSGDRRKEKLEFIDQVLHERKKRELNRLKIEKATIIQAGLRGMLCRNNVRLRLKTEISNKILELKLKVNKNLDFDLKDIKYLLSHIRFIYTKQFLRDLSSDRKKIDEVIMYATNAILRHKSAITLAMVEDTDWMWRIIYFLYLLMESIRWLLINIDGKISTILETIEEFSNAQNYQGSEFSNVTTYTNAIILGELVKSGLFNTLITVIERKYSLPKNIHSDNIITRIHRLFIMILSDVSSTNDLHFQQLPLKMIAKEIICQKMSIDTKKFIFLTFKEVEKFPLQALIKVMLDFNNERMFTIHTLHNFLGCFADQEVETSIEGDNGYFLLLSKLTSNIPLMRRLGGLPLIQSSEKIDNEDNVVLQECLSLINSSATSEKWLNSLVSFINRRHYDGIFLICKCVYNFWLYDRSPIHEYNLICNIAFQSHFLKELWNYINDVKRIFNRSGQVYNVTVLSMLSSGMVITCTEVNSIISALTMFCFFLKNHISLSNDKFLHEEELYGRGSGMFSLDEIVSISQLLKEVAVGIITLAFPSMTIQGIQQRIDSSTPNSHSKNLNTLEWRSLLEEMVSLLRLLHDLDCRWQLTKDSSFWVSSLFQHSNQPFSNFQKFEFVMPFTTPLEAVYSTSTAYENRYFATIHILPFTIEFFKRFTFYQSFITESKLEHQDPSMHFLQIPFLLLKIRRDYLYEDALEQISLELEMQQQFRVHLINSLGFEEIGIDGGGIFREFIIEFIKTAFDPNRGFFILNGDNQFYPNPNIGMICNNFKRHYTFIGKMLGKALFENILVDLPLADFFLSKIVYHSDELYINSLATLDPDLHKNLISLTCHNLDFAQLGLDFTLTLNDFGESKTVELKQDGRNIPVTKKNVLEYIYMVARFKAYSQIEEQTTSFIDGVNSVVPLLWLRMFTAKELQWIISGTEAPIDVEDMKDHAIYMGGYSPHHPTIIIFWRVVDAFTDLQKRLLMRFITSCPRPPLLGFKELSPPLCIQRLEYESNRLPSSSTCMNMLKLPQFSSEYELKERLLYAIQSKAGFELI